jgi:hypothetical protein
MGSDPSEGKNQSLGLATLHMFIYILSTDGLDRDRCYKFIVGRMPHNFSKILTN